MLLYVFEKVTSDLRNYKCIPGSINWYIAILFRSSNLLTSLLGIRWLVFVMWKLAFLANEMLGVFLRQPITECYATENPFSTYQNFYLVCTNYYQKKLILPVFRKRRHFTYLKSQLWFLLFWKSSRTKNYFTSCQKNNTLLLKKYIIFNI